MSEGGTEELFQLIVVGSSAGGIEALSQLVAALPSTFPLPIVLAQHLDPKRPSHLADILSRRSQLPVVMVEQSEKLKPGTIYVVPSNNHVEINDHHVRLLHDGAGRPKPSVDLLLSSAAEVYGEKLIAVILTGTGSDGKLGVRAVHENGGTVIAQNPATAAYPGMAQALAPETVDIVADLPQLGALLFDLVSGKTVPLHPDSNSELEPFLVQLHAHSGLDFRHYKPGTILRRLQRRIIAVGCSDLQDYTAYLQAHPEEYEQLAGSFLIKVTEFMRDPELFSYLREQILPNLIEYSQKNNDNELRFWSAGCATGQEAYSLAILVLEVLADKIKDFNIKIFATDVDASAIAFARRGFYSSDSLDKLPKELIERYFTLERDGYSVKKQVRELLVFGEHDLSQRAPFPRIDLVLCRNVLIYFSRELQQHALQLFAFALRDNGYLVLGRTESTSPLADFFVLQHEKQRVYQRHGSRHLTQPLVLKNNKPLNPALAAGRQQRQRETRNLFQMQQEIQHGRAAKSNLLLNLPIGVVVVDRHFDIQEINSAARRLLSIHSVAIGEDLVHLAQNLPSRELGAAITKTIRENTVTTLELVEVPHLTSGEPNFLQLCCYPHPGVNEGEKGADNIGYTLILVSDVTISFKNQRELELTISRQTQQVAELDQSLATLKNVNAELMERNRQLEQRNLELTVVSRQATEATQRHQRQMELLIENNRSVLAANEELTTLNADLRTTNEEYLLHTEEAQAAIEEADTLNEEMQATNEELETLNEELQATIEELNTSNADLAVQTDELRQRTEELQVGRQQSEQERAQLAAILGSMGDALMVVALDGKILLTNATYDQTFGGEKTLELLDEAGIKPLEAEATPQALAVKGVEFKLVFSLRLDDGSQQWWEAVGQPVYQSGERVLEVVVMRDITERSLRRLQEQFLSMVGHELRTPLTVIKGHIQLVRSWLEKYPALAEVDKPTRSINASLSQVEQLARLIADLTDLIRLESGKFRLNFSKVRLDELVPQIVETAQLLTTHQVIELNSVDEPLLIRGDMVRLQQLLFNLLNNALVHAPQSPKIIVSLCRLAANQVEITVQDFGSGIKAEHLPNLFSRFYQVAQGSEATIQGLGLGLFISQQIVVAHHGTLQVESQEGVGTTFSVQLPLLA